MIITREQYEGALANVGVIMTPELMRCSDECERLEALAQAVKRYEKEHFPIEPPSPRLSSELRATRNGMFNAVEHSTEGYGAGVASSVRSAQCLRNVPSGYSLRLTPAAGNTRSYNGNPQGNSFARANVRIREIP